MKKTLILTAALLGLALPAHAGGTFDCEVVKVANGNYFKLVDPTCGARFDGARGETAENRAEAEARDDAKGNEGKGDKS